MPGGVKAWEDYGSAFDATFDTTEGSKSRQILDAYQARKAAEKAARSGKEGGGG